MMLKDIVILSSELQKYYNIKGWKPNLFQSNHLGFCQGLVQAPCNLSRFLLTPSFDIGEHIGQSLTITLFCALQWYKWDDGGDHYHEDHLSDIFFTDAYGRDDVDHIAMFPLLGKQDTLLLWDDNYDDNVGHGGDTWEHEKANSLYRSQTEVAGDSDDEDHPEPVEEPAGKSRSWSPTHSVGHQVESNLRSRGEAGNFITRHQNS